MADLTAQAYEVLGSQPPPGHELLSTVVLHLTPPGHGEQQARYAAVMDALADLDLDRRAAPLARTILTVTGVRGEP